MRRLAQRHLSKSARRVLRLSAAALVLLVPSAALAQFTVSIAGPFTGRQAELGEDMAAAARLAIEDLNAAGGLLGQKIELRLEDDGCKVERAVGTAELLAAARIALVVGHPCSAAALSAASVYGRTQTLFIAPSTRVAALTDQRAGSTVFRLSGRDDRQGASAATALLSAAPAKRVAIVQDRTSYARGLTAGVVAELGLHGVKPLAVLPIVAGRREYPEVVAALKQSEIESVFFAGYPAEAAVILRQMRQAQLSAEFLGSDSLVTADFAETIRTSLSSGRVKALFAAQPEIANSSADLKARIFADGKQPTPLFLSTYAAIEVWAEGVRIANTVEPAAVAQAVGQSTLVTRAVGPISFDEKGDARVKPFVTVAWRSGKWLPVE